MYKLCHQVRQSQSLCLLQQNEPVALHSYSNIQIFRLTATVPSSTRTWAEHQSKVRPGSWTRSPELSSLWPSSSSTLCTGSITCTRRRRSESGSEDSVPILKIRFITGIRFQLPPEYPVKFMTIRSLPSDDTGYSFSFRLSGQIRDTIVLLNIGLSSRYSGLLHYNK